MTCESVFRCRSGRAPTPTRFEESRSKTDVQLLGAVREALAQAAEQQEQNSTSNELQMKVSRLSTREREVFDELIVGQNIKQIGIKFGTSPNTVRNQRSRILEKMAASSMADLVRMVLEGRPHQ